MKRTVFRRSLPLRVAAAAALAAGGLALAFSLTDVRRDAGPVIEAPAVSPAAARALGARWRETRRAETGRDYAAALLAAGLADELLGAIATEGLFAEDPAARSLFRAEALLRLYRHEEAIAETAAEPALADNPYAAFIRVRARAASGGGVDRDALAAATRGPADLAREAWLFRARAALAEGDFAAADASLQRAAEAGAAPARIDLLKIERAIRSGNTAEAAGALAERARRPAAHGRGAAGPDAEALRLAAMLALRAGDGRAAGRLADRAGLGAPGGPDAPLAAYAKWMAGDKAQADAMISAHLRAAPRDWVVRDLAAARAVAEGRTAEADTHFSALEAINPRLAAFRRMRLAEARRAFDAAYALLPAIAGETLVTGAAAALLGEGAASPLLPEPSPADRARAALAAASQARQAREGAARLFSLRRSPVDLAAASAAFSRASLDEEAAALAAEASRAADGFFAPVALRSALLEKQGRGSDALGLYDAFAARNAAHAPALIARARLLFRLADFEASAAAFAALDPAIVFADHQAALDFAHAAAAAGAPWRDGMLDAARSALPAGERLGRILDAAGDAAGAAAAYREALINDPGAADIASAYRAAMAQQGRSAEADALLEAIARRRRGAARPQSPDDGGV